MEIIDYLFIFWVSLTFIVIVVGKFFNKQSNNNQKHLKLNQQEEPNRRYSSVGDSWNTDYRSEPLVYHGSSQAYPNYSNQQNYNYSTYDNNYNNIGNLPDKDQDSAQAYSTQQVYGDNCQYRRASYLTNNQQPAGSNQHRVGQFENENYRYSQRFGSVANNKINNLSSLHQDNAIPTATGFNSDCVEWVNNILYLFYTQTEKYGSIITESVYRSLNEKLSNITSSSAEYSNLIMQLVGVNRELSTKPELTNIRTETESDKSVSAICKIYNKRLIFHLSIAPRVQRSQLTSTIVDSLSQDDHYSSNTGNSRQPQEYELILENLEGKLKSVAMLSEKLIVIQFMEKPDTKILLRPRYNELSTRSLINEDTLVSIILQTLTQVVVDLFFGDDADFPQYKGLLSNTSGYRNKLNQLKGSANDLKHQIKNDFFGALTSPFESKERKVFVKILRANNINYNQNVTCILELDFPYQQALSSTKQGSNPFWDEHFLFNIDERSNELVIELWDSINIPNHHDTSPRRRYVPGLSKNHKKWVKSEVTSAAKFLGLTRINIDELRRDPVQKVTLMLQSQLKPEQKAEIATEFRSGGLQVTDLSNSVGGELQVELLFLEHSPVSQSGEKQHLSFKKSSSASSLTYQQGDVVSIDRKLTPSGYVIRTTTITKTPNQQQQQLQKQQQLQQSRFDQLSVRNQSPAISSTSEQSDLDLNLNLDTISSQISADNQSRGLTLDQQQEQQEQQQQEDPHRSRSRSRSRSFLRAIKKRFSFSRTRSRSVGETGGSRSPSVLRDHDTHSTGIDGESRSRASSDASIGRAKSVPTSRDPNEVPIIVINKGRLSDTASAFTFTHPKSQLVIECTEAKLCADGSVKQNGHLRHYLIPDDASNKRRWSKRGLKLHIFNEHQFVACHLAGSSTCHLCGKVFSRRPGKQGYKCRNCHLLSHKQCHVKVDHNCPYATKEGLKLEYIDADPPVNLVEDARASSSASGTLPRKQQTKRPMKIVAKSVSMEVDDR